MAATVDDILDFVTKVYNVSLTYYSNDVEKANLNTIEYICVVKYGRWPFERLLGNPYIYLSSK
jgi:hypothetical protein